MANSLVKSAYALSQAARVGLYFGQYWLSWRMTTPVAPPRPIQGATPSTRRILADLRALLAKDWANVEAGVYRVPHDLIAAPAAAIRTAPLYFRDLRAIERRRHSASAREVPTHARDSRYPAYYLQNFHFQTDGWLSRHSAKLYDHQVEVLFGGGADAMRRQALVPLRQVMDRRGARAGMLLDMGCGTGRFLAFVKDNYPRLCVTALDLSPYYLDEARANLRRWRGVSYATAPAERTGFPDESYDVITCIYLFHELPGKVRRAVAAEAMRLLRSGGALILVDSLQLGDTPEYDGLLEYFPVAFHEPYFHDYIRCDLKALFENAGFRVAETRVAYFSRIMTMEKPE